MRISTVRVALALVIAPGLPLAGAEQGPPAVFVDAVEVEDPATREGIETALGAVLERLRDRDREFRLAESAEAAEVTVRITNYRTARVMRPKLERLILDGRVTIVERSEVMEVHYVDAYVSAGEAREALTGLDERDRGASIRNAASHLVDELERFCEEHCSP